LRAIAAISSGESGGTLAQQAMQQEDIDEANVIGADADRMEWIDIHTAHLDILDTALAKRPQRPLSRAGCAASA
jgi:hypothetical protein